MLKYVVGAVQCACDQGYTVGGSLFGPLLDRARDHSRAIAPPFAGITSNHLLRFVLYDPATEWVATLSQTHGPKSIISGVNGHLGF